MLILENKTKPKKKNFFFSKVLKSSTQSLKSKSKSYLNNTTKVLT